MEIVIHGDMFNKIMDTCIPAMSESDIRPALQRIELRCQGGVGTATALDGFMLAQCSFPYTGDDGVMLIRKHKTVANAREITIRADGDSISVSDGQETVISDACKHPFVDWQKLIEDRTGKPIKLQVTINRKLLLRALKSYEGKNHMGSIVLEFAGNSDSIIIRSMDNAVGIVLPMKQNNDVSRIYSRFPCEHSADAGEVNADD